MTEQYTRDDYHGWWSSWSLTARSNPGKFRAVIASYATEFIRSVSGACNCDAWHDEDE